jgi:predicted nucleic acid-binding protein
MTALVDRLAAGDRLLLDSSVLAAYLDGGERTSDLAAELLDGLVRSGRNPAVVSMVSVLETLIRPLRRLPAAHGTVLAFYREFPNLVAAPVDLDVAAEAANLRVAFGLSAPDALIAATSRSTGAATRFGNSR